jgi:hypothetical protein
VNNHGAILIWRIDGSKSRTGSGCSRWWLLTSQCQTHRATLRGFEADRTGVRYHTGVALQFAVFPACATATLRPRSRHVSPIPGVCPGNTTSQRHRMGPAHPLVGEPSQPHHPPLHAGSTSRKKRRGRRQRGERKREPAPVRRLTSRRGREREVPCSKADEGAEEAGAAHAPEV